MRKSKNLDSVILILKQAQFPMTTEDIFLKLKNDNNKLALSTVYRIINKLIEAKLVKESVNDGNSARYEYSENRHNHYLVCTKCKKLIPLDSCPVSEFEQKISKDTGFYITGHKYEIYGECQECHNK